MFPTFRLKPYTNTVQKGFEVDDLKYQSRPWIPFYDWADGFLWQLLEMGQISPTWGLCEQAKLKYVMGGGFSLLRGDYDPVLDELDDFERVKAGEIDGFRDWAKKVNQSNDADTLFEVTGRAANDFNKTGNAFVLCKWYSVGNDENFTIHHLPTLETRLGSDRESVWWSEHFRNPDHDTTESQAYQYPLYPIVGDDPEGNGRVTVIHLKNHEATHKFYGLPSSIMGLLNARSEYQSIRFRLTGLENNWSKDGVLILSGIQNSDEVTNAIRGNISYASGEGKNGGLDVLPFKGTDVNADLITYDKDSQGEFLETTKLDSETIFKVHGLHPTLVGEQIPGKLGNRQNFAEIFTLVSAQVIEPIRNKFISELLKPVAEMAGFQGYTPIFKNSNEIKTLIAMTHPAGVPETINERRKRFGLDEIEDGDVINIEQNGTNNSN